MNLQQLIDTKLADKIRLNENKEYNISLDQIFNTMTYDNRILKYSIDDIESHILSSIFWKTHNIKYLAKVHTPCMCGSEDCGCQYTYHVFRVPCHNQRQEDGKNIFRDPMPPPSPDLKQREIGVYRGIQNMLLPLKWCLNIFKHRVLRRQGAPPKSSRQNT